MPNRKSTWKCVHLESCATGTDVSNSAYAVVHCLGSPTFLSISFAFSNLSGNRILSSNLFNALSTRTIGILRFFISVVTFISIEFWFYKVNYFFVFLRTKNPSYSTFFFERKPILIFLAQNFKVFCYFRKKFCYSHIAS